MMIASAISLFSAAGFAAWVKATWTKGGKQHDISIASKIIASWFFLCAAFLMWSAFQ
jgi:hypothetical protein